MSNTEILVIVFVALILFGGKKLPHILKTWMKFSRLYRHNLNEFKRQAGLDMLENVTDFNTDTNSNVPPNPSNNKSQNKEEAESNLN
ncbi:twin-arginine translocase TatA/TatE family subunit [bacterium]|nr:twin-arginine translocase TatA/TatE family subunit [bacterium]